MGWPGYFFYAGTEIINASRTEAYAKHLNLGWFKPVYNEDQLAWLLGETDYATPLQDDAPWTDPDNLNSYDFYGAYPLEITGVEDSTVSAEVTESVIDGGYIGRVRRSTRSMVFTAALAGASECATEYGLRWLRTVLNGQPCFNQAYGVCGGYDLCYLACPPKFGEVEPTYSAGPVVFDAFNLAANPSAEVLQTNGWNTNDPTKWALSADAVAPISGTKSVLSTRQSPAVTVNLHKNPGLETGNVGGWVSNGGTLYAVTVDTTAPISGQFSAMSTRQAASPSNSVSSIYSNGSAGSSGLNVFPVTPGVAITWAADLRTELDGRYVNTTIGWRDAANGALGETAIQTTDLVSGQVTRVVITATPPVTAAFGYLILRVNATTGNAVTGERVWFDNGYAGFDPSGTYHDGDQAGYYWEGGRSLSATMQYGVPIPAARNLMLSPYDTAAQSATAVKYQSYESVVGATSIKVNGTYDGRPVTRVQATGTVWPTQPNLVTQGVNGTFEGNITGFTAQGSAVPTVAYDTTQAHGGTGSMKVTWPVATALTSAAYATITGLTVGQTYTLEAWLRVPADSVSAAPTARISGVAVVNVVSVADTWTLSQITWTATATSHLIGVTQNGTTTAGQTLYVDDVKVYAAQNLCTQGANGTFEGGVITGFSGGGTPPTLAASTTQAHGGTGSLRVTWPVASLGSSTAEFTATGLTIGAQYTFEAWLYIPTGSVDAGTALAGGAAGSTVSTRDGWVLSNVVFTATATNHILRVITRAASTAGQLCYVDDVRLYKSTATTRTGARSVQAANNPAIPAGTTFVFSTWMYFSTDYTLTGVNFIFRDDVNNDSAAVDVDVATPLTQATTTTGKWVRYSVRATVKAGRTVTGIYVTGNSNLFLPVGAYMDTTEWMVMVEGQGGTAAYFDGDSPGASWTGTPGASISQRAADTSSVPVPPVGASDNIVSSMYLTADPTTSFPCTEFKSITVAVDVVVEQANRQIAGHFSWVGGGVSPTVTKQAGPVGSVVRFVMTSTVPAGITAMQPVITVVNPSGLAWIGERVRYDNLYVGAAGGVYFDGSTPPGGEYTYAWLGAADQSPSVRYKKTYVPDPLPTSDDCYQQVGRTLHEVTTITGPTITKKLGLVDGSHVWTVTWTMVAANPAEFGIERHLVQGFLDPAVKDPYVDGLPDGAVFDPAGTVQTDPYCPVATYKPVYDPTCSLLVPPPDVPSVVPTCFSFPVNYRRRSFTVPRDSIPLWTEVVPIVALTTKTVEARNVRLRFYADVFDTGNPSSDPCNFCGDVVFSYIPTSSTIVLDGTSHQVYIDTPGIGRRRADSLVSDSSGNPFDWPIFSCGFGYVVTVDMPQQQKSLPVVDLTLVPRIL